MTILSARMKEALRIAQLALMFGITAYGVEELYIGGWFSRGILGIHWLYIVMFLTVLLAYFMLDRINILYVIPVGIAYYVLHEALFNLFFLSYHRFQNPIWATATWYEEIAAIAIATPVFIAISLKYRERFIRKGNEAKLAICLWSVLISLYVLRMAYGFPVSINVYDVFGVDTASRLANEFELATNILFALTFYTTFQFTRTRVQKSFRKSRPLLQASTVKLRGQ